MDIIKKLNIPGYLSLTSLLFAWISIILVISYQPNWAIFVNLIAFIFDLLDGYYARKLKVESGLGRQIDSYADIFTYLVFASLFFTTFIAPNKIIGVLAGFLILSFGGLRLIRFNNEGILKSNDREYYRGLTVVHINLIVMVSYFLSRFIFFWNPWISTVLVSFSSPFMLSNFKSYKIKNYWLFGLIISLLLTLSIILEHGHVK